ncbi:unnamed protein product [Dracunculus medinensis]|uniref:Dynein light intermediate chain n=1 Tax=Dracunculus medinensis TaxID=318479 RepID=A0A0N4UEK0_DRAME|nr:unnamed protein product [Dracunculus medinensis]
MPPTGTMNLPLSSITTAAPSVSSTNTDDERIWTQILSEVSANGTSNTPQGSILFLGGDRQSGKSWLLSRLEKREVSGRGSALEYHFLNVNTDYRDSSYAYQLSIAGGGVAPGESITLPVWVLDGDQAFAPLIKFALTNCLSRCVVVLCASILQPYSIIPTLNKWSKLLDSQIANIFDRGSIAEARKAQELFWQEYVEPLDSSMHSDKIPSMEAEQILLPLQQNILTHNTGVAVVVVLTKCDLAASELSDELLDRIQYHTRKFCMQHGAALVYTSAKEEQNTALLFKYLAHRVCGTPFTMPAHVVEKNAVFVPAGWDNEKKLDIIKETISDIEQPLEVVLFFIKMKIPRQRQQVKDQWIEAEDEQVFLQKLASIDATSSKKNMAQKTMNEGGDGNSPLISFFNNLLKNKEGQAVPAKVADPEAHLQRMLEQANNSAPVNPTTDVQLEK